MTQQSFQKGIRKISNNINAYYQSGSSNYACLVLHEHLGLVQNVVKISQYLLGQKITIMIPDLFSAVAEDSLLNNEFGAIKKLKYSHVEQVTEQCLKALKKNYKNVILIGFSIGSAYGLKIVEKIEGFSSAFLFYGLPNLNYLQIQKIPIECTLFYGTQDKIKYLSDPRMYQLLIDKCKEQKNQTLKFQRINGVGHGFMNFQSPNFSQKAVKQCKQIFLSKLPKQMQSGKIEGGGGNQKKEDCVIF